MADSSDQPSLAERVERLEVQNRLLKRAVAVLLALTGVGIFLGQHAIRGYADEVHRLERKLEQQSPAASQAPVSSTTAEPR
jgi:hypothetical protein